ncbi:hypothetical protein K1719_039919 [Acacia pycnantha]|nr:hypothetical protein K1719_039919 [Acacia pycnantha]
MGIGKHVGDWEHVMLRVSNFDGELKSVYLSKHNGGTSLQGANGAGNRNDTAASNMVVDMAIVYGEVSAEYLGSEIVEPPWLNYFREWGPKISYNVAEQLKKERPTGPKVKNCWNGDEVVR